MMNKLIAIKNFFTNYRKLILIALNSLILLIMFIFLILRFKYSTLFANDIEYLILKKDLFFCMRGQIITEIISMFLTTTLPSILNVNIQDFSFISHNVYSVLTYLLLIYMVASVFFKNSKINMYFSFLLILTFFMFNSFLFEYNFYWCQNLLQFFNGAVVGWIFFVIYFLYFIDFYTGKKHLSLRNGFVLFLLSCCVVTANVKIMFVFFFFFLLLFIDASICKRKNINFIIFALISVFMLGRHSCLSRGVLDFVYGLWNLQLNKDISFYSFVMYLKALNYELITNIFFLWIIILLAVVILLLDKSKRDENIKIIKYGLYMIIGSFIFFLLLYFLEPNLYFLTVERQFPAYWAYNPFFMVGYRFLIFIVCLFLVGRASFQKPKISIVLNILFIIFCTIYINNVLKNMTIDNFDHFAKFRSTEIYIEDKIALFYFRQGKTAILPLNGTFYALKMLKDEFGDSYKEPNRKYTIKESLYLEYLKKVYKVDVTPGFIFKTEKEALDEFYKNGGHITSNEIAKLKFSDI